MTRLLLLFLLLNNLVFAQNSTFYISGKVLDADTKKPLEFVQIEVTNLQTIGTLTDEKGMFSINNLTSGNYALQISYLGYEKLVLENIIIANENEKLPPTFLKKNTIQINEVEVLQIKSVADTFNFEEKQTLSSRSFTLEQTELIAGSLGDPSRIAFSFAGVRNQGDVQTGISIRGNSPNSLLWCVEGFEVQNPNHFSRGNLQGAINLINSNNLKYANFHTAAFPSRYNNGTSGVFDLYMRQGNTSKHKHSISLGVLGLEASTEGPLSKSKKHSYLVSYRYSTLSVLNKMGLNTVGNDLPTFQDINYKLFLNTKKIGVFELFGLWGKSEIVQIDEERRNYTYQDNYNYLLTGIKHQKLINENHRLVSGLIFSQAKSYFEDKKKDFRDDFIYPINDQILQFDTKIFSKFSEKHKLVAGFNVQMPILYFEANSFQSNDTVYRNADVKTLKTQVHLEQSYEFNKNWLLKLGFNIQHFQFNKSTTVDPRLNLEKNWNNNHKITLGVGLHSKLENLGFYGINITRVSVQNNVFRERSLFNQNLQPTRSLHFVAAYQWKITEDLSFTSEIYFQHIYNVPVSERENNFLYSALNEMFLYYSQPLVNKGLGRNYGIDFTLEKKYNKGYYILATSSLYQSKYKNPLFDEWFNTRYNGNFILNVVLGKDFIIGKEKLNKFSISARSTWAGNNRREFDFFYTEPFQNRLKNYYRLDTRFAYKRNKEKYQYTLSFDIQNTTNRINENPVNNISGVGIIPFLTYRVEF